MRTHHTTARVLWLVPMLAAVACGGEKPARQTAASAPPAATAAPRITMATRNSSGITGSAMLAASGDSTTITVALHGVAPGQTYASHVHAGGCDKPGAMLIPLTSVVAGADSAGTSTTTIATARLDSARTQHGALLVQSHLPSGTPAACGDLPAH